MNSTSSPVSSDPARSRLEAVSNAPAPPPEQPEQDGLADNLGTLVEARWLILACGVVCLLAALGYGVWATPIYRTDALLQVEEMASGMRGLDELSSVLGGEVPSDTEIEILRSRSLVGGVVDALRLDVRVAPHHFPLVGQVVARRHLGPPASAPLGLSRYAWGGEALVVRRLNVGEAWLGVELVLVAGDDGAYQVLSPQRELLLEGKVGQIAKVTGPSARFSVELFVSELVARPGTEFLVKQVARAAAIRELQSSLSIRERGRQTGILELSLEGPNRLQIPAILDTLASTYLRENVERKSEEAEKTLQFLNTQLPTLKQNLETAESALNEYRAGKGSVDLTMAAEALMGQSVDLEKKVSELEVQRADLRQRFTDSHPSLISLRKKMEQLERERKGIEERLKRLPQTELTAVRYMRDVKVANELYVLLLNKAQELKIVKSGTVGNVRIVDVAIEPTVPVKPRRGLLVGFGLVVGLGLGISLAFARRALQRAVEDPDEVERSVGVPVYCAVPHSPKQDEILAALRRRKGSLAQVLALSDPGDLAIESLRSLRTSLQFALMDAKSNVIAVSGPSPGIGKSFICVNLAHVLADAGKRILLVDADMRKGRLHTYLGLEKTPGLSEVISGQVAWKDAVRVTTAKGVHTLPMGAIPPNPSELLLGESFQPFVEEVQKEYDLVVIDTPPVLAVTDAALVGRLAGVTLMVVRAGEHPLREIVTAVRRLEQNGVRTHGVIFNDVRKRASRYGHYGYHYQYQYK